MRALNPNRLWACLGAGVAFFVTAASAQTESILYNFSTSVDPSGRFVQLKSGALLGATFYGGTHGAGSIYQLKESNGTWRYKQAYSFYGSGGTNPFDGLSINKSDALFGTAEDGGAHGYGTVYALSPSGSGWTQTVLYNFNGNEGAYPEAVLIVDAATNALYGTTSETTVGSRCGNVFSVTPQGDFTVLYTFAGVNDGCTPQTGMTWGTTAGTIFGTTRGGGRGSGTVFELKESEGIWSEKVIYRFTGGTDGGEPSDFRIDANGNLFGVASGGLYGEGVVFELTKSDRNWREKTLYAFRGGSDGATPIGLHLDLTTGAVYGATEFGGTYGEGTVFELAPSGQNWTESILHSFGADGDGAYPVSRPIQDKVTGNLYGATDQGGRYGVGVVYMIAP